MLTGVERLFNVPLDEVSTSPKCPSSIAGCQSAREAMLCYSGLPACFRAPELSFIGRGKTKKAEQTLLGILGIKNVPGDCAGDVERRTTEPLGGDSEVALS